MAAVQRLFVLSMHRTRTLSDKMIDHRVHTSSLTVQHNGTIDELNLLLRLEHVYR